MCSRITATIFDAIVALTLPISWTNPETYVVATVLNAEEKGAKKKVTIREAYETAESFKIADTSNTDDGYLWHQ